MLVNSWPKKQYAVSYAENLKMEIITKNSSYKFVSVKFDTNYNRADVPHILIDSVRIPNLTDCLDINLMSSFIFTPVDSIQKQSNMCIQIYAFMKYKMFNSNPET